MKKPYRIVGISTILLVIVIVIFGSAMYDPREGVYIADVCAHNDGIVHDSVGFYNDFIILGNSSKDAVSLKGYWLSDDNRNLKKFELPDKTLMPGDNILIWANEKTVFGDGFTDDDGIYTGFRLRDNEKVYLSEADGTVADSKAVQPQKAKTPLSGEEIARRFPFEPDLSETGHGVYTVFIVADPDDLFSAERGIYVNGSIWDKYGKEALEKEADGSGLPANFNMRGSGWKRDARLILYDPDGNLLYDEAGRIGIRGLNSRALPQKSFSLLPETEGGRVFDGLFENAGSSLMLRTGSTDDAFVTNFRDALNMKIARDLDVCPEESVCCELFINGQYWGCYNLQERPDESLLSARYGVDKSRINVIKINGEPEASSGKESDLHQYKLLDDYVRKHDLSDDRFYEQFCEKVDIDNLIDYYCAEIFFANADAYYSNVGLWRVRTPGLLPYEDGKWRFFLYDTDDTDAFSERSYADADSFVEGSWIGINAMDDLFFSSLAKNASFREKFRNRFTQLLDSDFSPQRTLPVIDEMEKIYTEPMVRSVRKYDDPSFTEDDYKANVEAVREFFQNRSDHIRRYMMEHIGD
ncbi:MAG: CotH kinase family protein [Lachnospiraceae bacterium]|nr:CotH kinase family protein [Lachnospiraceae bacterium]